MARLWGRLSVSAAAICIASAAEAQPTTTYTYDALGRLVKVERSDGVKTEYTYDNAGNRVNVTVTGASSCSNATPTWGTGTYGCFRWGQ